MPHVTRLLAAIFLASGLSITAAPLAYADTCEGQPVSEECPAPQPSPPPPPSDTCEGQPVSEECPSSPPPVDTCAEHPTKDGCLQPCVTADLAAVVAEQAATLDRKQRRIERLRAKLAAAQGR